MVRYILVEALKCVAMKKIDASLSSYVDTLSITQS